MIQSTISEIDKNSEGDEEGEDSQNKSVSLEDKDLGKLSCRLTINMNIKIKGMDSVLQHAIKEAEAADANESSQEQQEEYESLVFRSSIWSTDIQKESK